MMLTVCLGVGGGRRVFCPKVSNICVILEFWNEMFFMSSDEIFGSFEILNHGASACSFSKKNYDLEFTLIRG